MQGKALGGPTMRSARGPKRALVGVAGMLMAVPAVIMAGGSATASASAGKMPYVLASIQTPLVYSDDDAGMVAAVKAINATGGVDDHPIKLIVCQDNNAAAVAESCARSAIGNSSVLALTDTTSPNGTSYDALLQQADMANFGLLMSTPADFSNPTSFPLFGGSLNSVTGAEAAVKSLGDKSIGAPYIDVAGGAQLPSLLSIFVKPAGGSVVGVEAIPPTATDYASYAATEIAAKPSIVTDAQTAEMFESFIKEVESQGGKLSYQVSAGVFDAKQLMSKFGNSVKFVIINEYNHTAPGFNSFLKGMAKYNSSAPDVNDSALSGWVGIMGMVQVLKALHSEGITPTRSAILSYLSHDSKFDVQGLTGGVNFTKPSTLLSGAIPRVFTTSIWMAYAKNGKEVPISNNQPFTLSG
jgi:ABC-type branched-subunit amino acid transport system substrate-binding protein